MNLKKIKEISNNILLCIETIKNIEDDRNSAIKSFQHWKNRSDDFFNNLELASKNIIKTGGKIYFQQLQIKQLIKQLNKEIKK